MANVRRLERDGEERGGRALPQVELSIVVAVRDAEPTIGGTLERLALWVRHTGRLAEVVVVDDGSVDATDGAARLWRGRFDGFQVCRHERRRGLGAAARTGVLTARGSSILVADPELNLLHENARSLLSSLENGADVAVLSRRTRLAAAERPFLERAADTTFLALSRLFVPTGVRDGLCGLVGLRQPAGKKIAERGRVDGPAFLMEWLAMARMFRFHVAESEMLSSQPGCRTSLLTPAGAPGMLKDLWQTHRRLAADDYMGAALPKGALMHKTSFVRLDRSELAAAGRKAR